jgi:inositol-phosphate transport system ATP-binding protein
MEIRLDKFCKSFGPVTVIEDMNLTIGDGEMIALLGPSGCGKTTTLFAISGVHKVTSGRIFFGARDVTELPPQQRNVGVVFQSFALYPHLTVFENIAFPLRIRKESGAEIERKVTEVTGVLKIAELIERRPGQLSGGQQQRVALARALVRSPDVLLMDEPLANLDAGLRLEMRAEIRRIQREAGCTAVLVTHDQIEAMSMCDRIALMNEGRILQIGTPGEMYRAPKNTVVAAFIGSPPISFCTGAVRDGRFVAEGIAFEAPDRLIRATRAANGAITIGVRPESLQSEGGVPVDGVIAAVEPHGRETLYTLTLAGGAILRSVQTGRESRRPGEKVRWGLDAASVLFFDAAGERIA